MIRILAATIYFSSLLAAFAGREPPDYYDTPQSAAEAEAISQWSGQLSAFKTFSPLRPSAAEQATVALNQGRFAAIFARAAPVAVHGGSLKVALFALFVRDRRG